MKEIILEKRFSQPKEKKQNMSVDLKIIDYSEKAVLVTGKSTHEFKEDLKQMHGKWMVSKEKKMSGWIFSKKHKSKLEKFIANLKSNLKVLKQVVKTEKHLQGKTLVVAAAPKEESGFLVTEVKKASKSTAPAQVVVRNAPMPRAVVPSVSRILKHEYLLPAEYFSSENELHEWQYETEQTMGWVLYMEKLFPDACPVVMTGKMLLESGMDEDQMEELPEFVDLVFYEAGRQRFDSESFHQYGRLQVFKNLGSILKSCKVKRKRLAIIPLSIVMEDLVGTNHQNALILDIPAKKLYRFDPNGAGFGDNSVLNQEAIDKDFRQAIQSNADLKALITEYVPPIGFCPKIGVQPLEGSAGIPKNPGEPHGYCVAWSLLFIHAALENPQMSLKEIAKALLADEEGDNLRKKIKAYLAFVARKRQELRKFYQAHMDSPQ